ncbi:rho guanine nucleotide exchange factor 19 isoform X2 [Gadus macrocephalus]|uniref:rho guanine nucleotide exchange factor 19 isoform X2 n=2 Tax=Gadus macrocephalus TaxID=80720 RepID=UPI0028CB2A27|nr:rho guanine nucleotide exchange factor 19 isoform X2 [Gadus macrocephalus]
MMNSMEEPGHLSQTMKAWAHFLNEGEKTEDPCEGTAVDIAVALRSVASARTWSLGKAGSRVDRFMSAFGLEKECVEDLSPTVVQAQTTGGPADPVAPFKSKYLHVFPLYQDYCHHAVEDLPGEGLVPEPIRSQSCEDLPAEGLVPEPITSESILALQGIRFRAKFQVIVPPPQVIVPPPQVTVPPPPPARFPRDHLTTFWQDLDEVKECGVLATLSPREVHRQEAMFEVIGSEASYLRSLGVAVNHFMASKKLSRTVSPLEHHVLFSNLRHVMSASESFLVALERLLGECVVIPQLGGLMLQHCPRFRALYVPYLSNMMFQEALVNKLLQENKGFVSALKTLERDPVCQRRSLKSFLVLPFQRITRLKLLMEHVLTLTEPDADSYLTLIKALVGLHKVIMECNEGVRRMKQIEELVRLEVLLDFSNFKLLPLVVKGRFLLHDGPLRQLNRVGPDSKISFTDVHLHLFSDLLVISVQKEQRFGVLDHTSFPGNVRVELVNAGMLALPTDSFLLHLSQNHAGHATALILAARSRSDQMAWMKMLSAQC